MLFTDITHSQQNTFTINTPGKHVFFLFNRSGEVVFDVAVPGAEAYIFALFAGKGEEKFSLRVKQHHTAPQTLSRLLVKSVLREQSQLRSEGLIRIEKEAQASDAEQTSRHLLLSSQVQVFTQPDLEILADDVQCRHAATVSKINPEHIFYATSRGLSASEAEQLLTKGFVADFFETIERVGAFPALEQYQSLSLEH
jgi:Fe-S cluster assembly scaffold protein SufB